MRCFRNKIFQSLQLFEVGNKHKLFFWCFSEKAERRQKCDRQNKHRRQMEKTSQKFRCIALSIFQPARLSIYLWLCLTIYLSADLFVCLTICLSICQTVCLYARLSVYQPICLSVCLSICISVRLSVHTSIRLSVGLLVSRSDCLSA
jgi:hypothetical protein